MNTLVVKVKVDKIKHYFISYRLRKLFKRDKKHKKSLQNYADSSELEDSQNLFKEKDYFKSQSKNTTTLELPTNKITEDKLHFVVLSRAKDEFIKLLRKGHDITAKDDKGNTVLHIIASLCGQQESTEYFSLILNLVNKKKIPRVKLSNAINAHNDNGYTPIQVALIKEVNKLPLKLKWVNRACGSRNYDDTVNFCTELLKNGAQDQKKHLTLPKEFYNTTYYKLMKRINERTGFTPDLDTWKELQMFSKNGSKNSSKNSSKNIDLSGKLILGGLICALVFSVLAGNMGNAATLSLIIVFYVICCHIYSQLENVLNRSESLKGQNLSSTLGCAENPNTKIGNTSSIEESQDPSNPRTILNGISIIKKNSCETVNLIRQYFL